MTYGQFEDFDYVITDRPPESPYADAVRQSGARLLVASAP